METHLTASTPPTPSISPVAEGARPVISVVTATYNALGPLHQTVTDVSAQSVDLEHIIVDGGSTDGTPGYLSSLGAKVNEISEPDLGIADAMNKGIAMARGEWILVLHAGDRTDDPEILTKAVDLLTPQMDVLLCGIRRGGSAPDKVQHFRFARQRLIFKAIWHQGALTRRSLFERIGGFDTSYRVAMDYEFYLRARNAGARFHSAALILSHMDDSGISSRNDWPSLQHRFSEERRAQLSHCSGAGMRAVYTVYWPPYLAYRRLRSLL